MSALHSMSFGYGRRSRRRTYYDVPGASETEGLLPLCRVRPGVWRSRDGRWTFMRHESDSNPKRWFAYEDDSEDPVMMGSGAISLREAVRDVVGK